MHGFATEQYMDILVKIVNRDALTDLSNEVKFFAVSCLTTLMDIFPSLVNSLVNTGLLKGMTQLMQNTMGFIDLAEACIKAYEKIALENPSAVLKSGAIGCVLQHRKEHMNMDHAFLGYNITGDYPVEEVIKELKKYGRDDIMVIVGGVIPKQDYQFLFDAGAVAVFGPGTKISEAAIKILEILID